MAASKTFPKQEPQRTLYKYIVKSTNKTIDFCSSFPWPLFFLSIVYTTLNAVKPLHIDDAAYFYYAKQASAHPLDPYGFEVFWYQAPQPANQILSPPLIPYWWSLAIRIFGDSPLLWKLWLWPFVALFIFSTFSLTRRFANGFENLLVWMLTLSPLFFPSLNLMLDIPSLALKLFGLTVFLHSCDRNSFPRAILAGFVCALSIETKYTGLVGTIAIIAYGILACKFRLALTAIVISSLFVFSWEYLVAFRYGQSHFLYHLYAKPTPPPRSLLFDLLFIMIGGTSPHLTVLALKSLGVRNFFAAALFSLSILPLAMIASPLPSLNHLGTQTYALAGFIQYSSISFSLFVRSAKAVKHRHLFELLKNNKTLFLVSWCIFETTAYFLMSPFVAARRVMGVVFVASLLAARLTSQDNQHSSRFKGLLGSTTVCIIISILFFVVDFRDAVAQKEAAEQAAAWIPHSTEQTTWFVGHWGFQFYAERHGMKPVVSGISRLRCGDWLIVPDHTINHQQISDISQFTKLVNTIRINDHIPFRVAPAYYGDPHPAVIEHLVGDRVLVRIYEVCIDFTP